MKKLLLSLSLTAVLTMSGQTTIFEDNFDSYTNFEKTAVGSWTLIDLDLRPTYGFSGASFTNEQTAMAFIVFNSTATSPALTVGTTSDWTARSGQKAMACIASVPNATVSANDDWLISPQITLAASGNQLSFWAKSCDGQYPDEQFQVFVSTTNTNVSSFASLGQIEITSFGPYVEYTYDLTQYNGQSVYIGIHCVSEDQFGLMIDDFKVTTTALNVNDSFASKFSTYPNPANDLVNITSPENITLDSISINDINGRTVKTVDLNNVSEAQINVSDLNSGVYFMNIVSDSGTAVKKFIKN